MFKRLLSTCGLIAAAAAVVVAQEPATVWEGNEEIGDWSGGVTIEASKLTAATENSKVTVEFTPGSDAAFNASVANGGPVIQGLKNLPSYTEWGCVFVSGVSSITFPLTEDDAQKIAADGMYVNGKNITVKKVILVPADYPVIWEGHTLLNYEDGKVNIPAFYFAAAKAGDVVTLDIQLAEGSENGTLYVKPTGESEFLQGFVAANDTWGAWIDKTGPSTFALTDADANVLKEKGMSIDADPGKLILTKVTLTPEKIGTGITSAVVDETDAPRYFNIQGVEVAEPRAGNIYIVVRGGKAVKQLYR